jgi:antitoxin HigA-1
MHDHDDEEPAPPRPFGAARLHRTARPYDYRGRSSIGRDAADLNNLVNGKSGISADMAIRLDKALGGGAETWLRLQMAYDLAQARQHEADIDVKPVSRSKLHEPHP